MHPRGGRCRDDGGDGRTGRTSRRDSRDEISGTRGRCDALTARVRRTPASGPLFEMTRRLWQRRQGKQRRSCIGIDKVSPERGAKELMAGVSARQ